jgi:peroxiredoxin
MALVQSFMVPLGTPAPPFDLPGVDGRNHSLEEYAESPVLVVVFTCNHCPYAVASEERLIEIQRDYGPRGVQLVAINPNDDESYPEDSFENMQRRAAERGFNFPYLRDADQETARAYRAACTPDIFVYGPDRTLAYRGRIDDNWRDPAAVKDKSLRRALDAILAGKPAPTPQIPSMGCSIKWR